MTKRSVASVLFVAHYLLVVTVGPWFHAHGPSGPSAGDRHEARCPCERFACGHGVAEHGDGAPGEITIRVGSGEVGQGQTGATCPICQFLGKKPAPAQFSSFGTGVFCIEEAAVFVPPSIAAEPHRFLLIRGPPSPV